MTYAALTLRFLIELCALAALAVALVVANQAHQFLTSHRNRLRALIVAPKNRKP